MRWILAACIMAAPLITETSLLAQASLAAPQATIGNRLETPANVALTVPAPEPGLDITLRSKDPAKLLLSKAPDQAGTAILVLHLKPNNRESPDFWLQALGSTGSVEYTAEAPGYSTGTGTVSLKPSAIVLMGPFKAPSFPTTIKAAPIALTLMAARLEDSLDFAEEQAIAGGLTIEPELANSKPSIGAIISRPQSMTGGTSSQIVRFQPAQEGETTLSLVASPSFSKPKQFGAVTIVARKPGLAVSDQTYIGQNLQIAGVLSLGEAAPKDGLRVTLTSSDKDRLLLSRSATEVGSKSITVEVPAGGTGGQYYLQALGGTGTVTYTASAEGFQTREGTIGLAPSGILITPASQGPPDEAHVLRPIAPESAHHWAASLAKPLKSDFIIWTAQLDPTTHRGADITVQPLRAGMTLSVTLTNSNPGVAGVASSVTIKPSFDHGTVEFTPLGVGTSEIDVTTPAGFMPAANSTKIIVAVDK